MPYNEEPDVVYLKQELRLYQKAKGITDPKIGEILGSTAKSSGARGEFTRAFYENPEYEISLNQIVSIARFMGRPVKSLLFREKGSVIHSAGDHAMNAINMGSGGMKQEKKCHGSLYDEKEIIEHFRKCEEEQLENYKDFIEYMQIKRRNDASKKKSDA